jgi:FlaA1/EpsC-like NDP-sugar epimerase
MELDRVGAYLNGEVVLVTGAGGSIGKELSLEYAGSLIPQDTTPLVLLTLSDLEQRRRLNVGAAATQATTA